MGAATNWEEIEQEQIDLGLSENVVKCQDVIVAQSTRRVGALPFRLLALIALEINNLASTKSSRIEASECAVI